MFQFNRDKIIISKEKNKEKKSVKETNVRNVNVIKIMQTNNAFLNTILIICDSEFESESAKSSFFIKLKNIKN